MNFFLFWISEIFLTWMVSRLSSCDFFSCQAVVSREAYAWRMLSSFGWKPVLRQARSQALDTTGQMRRMPPHGQDYTPNPARMRMMAPLVEMRWASHITILQTPEAHDLLIVGHSSVRTGGISHRTSQCHHWEKQSGCGIYPWMPLSLKWGHRMLSS